MRIRRITLWKRLGPKGELDLGEKAADFCRGHKGKPVLVRISVQSEEPSEKLTNYFFGYVVKELQRAMHENGEDLREAEVYDRIRTECPLFLEENRENGEWKVRAKEWEELDVAEAVEIVAWVQRWASENYYWVIEDPE